MVVKCTNPESFELYPFTTKGGNREALVSTAKANPFGKVSVQRVDPIKVDKTKYGESSYPWTRTDGPGACRGCSPKARPTSCENNRIGKVRDAGEAGGVSGKRFANHPVGAG